MAEIELSVFMKYIVLFSPWRGRQREVEREQCE